jgi:hypothetical protein
VEERRSTWQSWHVRAEAQRHVRAVTVPTAKVDQLVELLVDEALQIRSISLARPEDGITEPVVLRKTDGSSVYTVAGSELFTSARILAAEQRLVAAAGRTDGRVLDAATAELALLESAANGTALDAGQAALVRAMCTSGVRLQLAIAPAGAGKTPAMRTLAGAWRDSGGHVVGWPGRPPQPPSSATQLADQVRSNAADEAPAWAAVRRALVPAELIANVQVWRAATEVDPVDLRPTGPAQHDNAAQIFQQRLDKRLATSDTHADLRWRQLLARESPRATADPVPARAGRKIVESRQGRLRRHPSRAVGGGRRTPTRRPPRRSALVAHPRSATPNTEHRPRRDQRCPSDERDNHAVTRPAATQAALGAAARVRPSR